MPMRDSRGGGGYDPWSGMKNATNALFGVAASAQRDRMLANDEDRTRVLNEKWDSEKVMIPLKYQQAKMEVGMQLLPGLKRENYGKFHKWSLEPIDKKTGHGGIPEELLPSAEQVAAMDDNQFEELKKRMFISAKQLSEMSVADYKAKLDKDRIDLASQNAMKEIEARGRVAEASDARTMSQINARTALEDRQHQNALALTDARHKGEMTELGKRIELAGTGGGRSGGRDPRQMDIMNRVQSLTDERRKLEANLLPGMPAPEGVFKQIDTEIAELGKLYQSLGYDPRDLLQGGTAGPAAAPQEVKTRVYVPGKGFIEQPQAAGMTR